MQLVYVQTSNALCCSLPSLCRCLRVCMCAHCQKGKGALAMAESHPDTVEALVQLRASARGLPATVRLCTHAGTVPRHSTSLGQSHVARSLWCYTAQGSGVGSQLGAKKALTAATTATMVRPRRRHHSRVQKSNRSDGTMYAKCCCVATRYSIHISKHRSYCVVDKGSWSSSKQVTFVLTRLSGSACDDPRATTLRTALPSRRARRHAARLAW